MTYCHPLCAMSISPPILRYSFSKFDHENPWSRSCVWSKVKGMFNLENSKVKVMVKVKPDGHIWGLGVLSICLLFVSWQSDHFWLRYSKFYIWPWKFKVKVRTKIAQHLIRWSTGQSQQPCQKWKKSEKLLKSYRVNTNLRPAATPAPAAAAAPAAAHEPVQNIKSPPVEPVSIYIYVELGLTQVFLHICEYHPAKKSWLDCL